MKPLPTLFRPLNGIQGGTFLISFQRDEQLEPYVIFAALQKLSKVQIEVWAFAILPKQVHLLFSFADPMALNFELLNSLSSLLFSPLKEYLPVNSGFRPILTDCQIIMNRATFYRLLNLTIQAPVKAGLTNHWLNWKWKYLNPYYP